MKRLRHAIVLCLLSVIAPLLLFSCTHDLSGIGPDEDDSILVTFDLTKSNSPSLYAISDDKEAEVSKLSLLLFNIKNELINDTPISGLVTFVSQRHVKVEATIRSGFYGNVMLLANYNDELAGKNLVKGMSYDDVRALLDLRLNDKWKTDTSSPGYEIPMYGETGLINVKNTATNSFSTTLTRMLCRVDVKVNDTAKPNFKLTRVLVYNRDLVGMLPTSKVNRKPHMPATPSKAIDSLVYDEITTIDEEIAGEIYLMESLVVRDNDDKLRLSDAICLVVGGYYTSTNNPTVYTDELYYRVDFALNESATEIYPKHYYDLLRNHLYNINIVSVSGPGTLKPGEALEKESSYIEVEVIDWGNGGAIDGAVDGQHTLRLSQGEFILSSNQHTKDSEESKLTVSSDHPDGWWIEKITEEDGSTMPADGWLSTTLAIGAVQASDKTFSLLLKENGPLAPRVGYIFIQSGPRMVYKLKVTQENKVFAKDIIWLDYDGVSGLPENKDGDTGLTSITVERPGMSAQTSDITQGELDASIQVDRATKVTVTYKGYALDLPLADYTVDAVSGKITITNRSLIGKPRHLDEIRRQVNADGHIIGSYIQVADINLATYKDLSGETDNWLPIGDSNAEFSGSYDGGSGNAGKGFGISSLNIDRQSTINIGLFGSISSTATVKRIHITSGVIKGKDHVGGIAGFSATPISNCSNAASIESIGSGSSYAGGIVGRGSANIEGCTNNAPIKGAGNYVGGISGSVSSPFILADCRNLAGGTVSGLAYVGGICGNSTGLIKDSHNAGSISTTVIGESIAGGIVGRGAHVLRSTNAGSVTGTGSHVGGIVGYITTSTSIVADCKNLIGATVSGTSNVGGICGWNTATINNCTNEAATTGGDRVGGIIGYSNSTDIVAINNCDNLAGGVISGDKYVGGICGMTEGRNTAFRRCDNLAGNSVSGVSFVGGVCGSNGNETLSIEGSTIDACTNAASVTGTDKNIGGITGYSIGERSTVVDCTNYLQGKTEGIENVGGICGLNTTRSTISGSKNMAPVTGTTYIGGVCGINEIGGELFESENYATVKGTGTAQYIGGICGESRVGMILNCKNMPGGDVEGVSYIGGVCGLNYSSITGSTNAARVTGSDTVAGICGQNGYSDTSSGRYIDGGAISSCTNSGDISGGANYVAGICGLNGMGDSKGGPVESCENSGVVEGTSWVSGICGYSNGVLAVISKCTNKADIIGRTHYVGGVCGQNNAGASIADCASEPAATITGVNFVGGICGWSANAPGIISGCTNASNVSGRLHIGGVCGSTMSDAQINASTNAGAITGVTNNIGGICGQILAGSIIDKCINTGNVSKTGTGAFSNVGGICGYNNSGTIRNLCLNSGAISGTQINVGGVCGNMNAGTIDNSSNSGIIDGPRQVGGICGNTSDAASKITNSHNLLLGSVTAGSYVGGISGTGYGSISHCSNQAVITASAAIVGGIAGYAPATTIQSCTNLGNINATGAGPSAGGIVGAGFKTINCINEGHITATDGGTFVGGICGTSTPNFTLACYNLGEVIAAGTRKGAINGDNYAPKNCFYGRYAIGFTNSAGSTKFGSAVGEWPTEELALQGWEKAPIGAWEDLGSLNVAYPKLAPPTPAP